MTRLLVECTYVFEHPKVNSGIQRVVRNVIRELPEADETVECIPVAMLDGTLYQVHSLAPLDPRPHSPLVRLRILVERAATTSGWASAPWKSAARSVPRRGPGAFSM